MSSLELVVILVVLVVGVFGTAFCIWMLIDCLTKEPSEGNDKLAWVVVIAVTHLIGAAIYFFVRRRARLAQA